MESEVYKKIFTWNKRAHPYFSSHIMRMKTASVIRYYGGIWKDKKINIQYSSSYLFNDVSTHIPNDFVKISGI